MPHSNPNPDPTPIGAPPEYSLGELETLARQKEEIYGLLYRLGNDGAQTIMTFDFKYQRPAKSELVLRQAVGGQPIPLAGKTLVCQGICFVADQRLDIAAYR